MSGIYIAITVVSAVAAATFIGWFIWFSNNCIKLTHYGVSSDNLPEKGIRIVHLSDLHAKRFKKGNAKLVSIVKKQQPDMIVFTGDIIHKYRQRDEDVAVEFAAAMAGVAPFYYVCGNHEMRNKKYVSLRNRLKEAGAIIMDDRAEELPGITLVGLNCANLKNNKIFSVMPQGKGFKVLLAHEPQMLVKYARSGCDLVLCGHAHGGQWRIPFTDIGIFSPGQGLFPKLTSGRHISGGTQMIISRGLGNSECPLRLFNRPEVVVINLKHRN